MFQPAIKWSGSKRSQSEFLLSHFPQQIKTYYEPFCGGCSMLRALLDSNIKVDNYICSDINNDLIDLWIEIKNNPEQVIGSYTNMWNELNIDDDKNRKKEYFYSVRRRFNDFKNPTDFMFIMRTTTNGMPRYNLKGEFNNSFHVTRNGIIPKTFKKIIYEWSVLLNDNNVIFKNQSYLDINSIDGDFLYLDPPYANTNGMYYGVIDYDDLWNWMANQSNYILSFDGISGEEDNTFKVPKRVYSEHKYVLSGNSSFKRTIGKSNDSIVYESLYIK